MKNTYEQCLKREKNREYFWARSKQGAFETAMSHLEDGIVSPDKDSRLAAHFANQRSFRNGALTHILAQKHGQAMNRAVSRLWRKSNRDALTLTLKLVTINGECSRDKSIQAIMLANEAGLANFDGGRLFDLSHQCATFPKPDKSGKGWDNARKNYERNLHRLNTIFQT